MNFGRFQIALLLVSPLTAFAVSPLTTDDADPVELGRLQLNTGWQFHRTDSVRLHSLPVNAVLGITSFAELGATFGYQWRDDSSPTPSAPDANGYTDFTLATKWKLWQTENERFKFGARLDLKLPTASEQRGLGSGHADVGLVLIGTGNWGTIHLDWNIGYTATDAGGSIFGDDQWFLGQAIRHELNERWTLIGETYLLVPQGSTGGDPTFHFSGGAQFNVTGNFLFSVLIGSAAGPNRPDFTSYLGLTCVF